MEWPIWQLFVAVDEWHDAARAVARDAYRHAIEAMWREISHHDESRGTQTKGRDTVASRVGGKGSR